MVASSITRVRDVPRVPMASGARGTRVAAHAGGREQHRMIRKLASCQAGDLSFDGLGEGTRVPL